jgi:hypothetical protein
MIVRINTTMLPPCELPNTLLTVALKHDITSCLKALNYRKIFEGTLAFVEKCHTTVLLSAKTSIFIYDVDETHKAKKPASPII